MRRCHPRPVRARVAIAVAVALAASQPARADEAPPPGTAAPLLAPAPPLDPDLPGASESDAPCDEEGPKRKGVQKRDFIKRLRLELSAWGGFFAADLVSTSYAYGGALAFFPTEDFGVEASLVVTHFDLAVEKPLSDLFGGQRFTPGLAFVVVGNLLWAPVHLKVRASERAIVHGDFFFTLGAGDTIHDSAQGVTFDAGLGLKLYPTRFLAVRFDLRDYIILQEAVGAQRTTNNLVGLLGLSLFLPP